VKGRASPYEDTINSAHTTVEAAYVATNGRWEPPHPLGAFTFTSRWLIDLRPLSHSQVAAASANYASTSLLAKARGQPEMEDRVVLLSHSFVRSSDCVNVHLDLHVTLCLHQTVSQDAVSIATQQWIDHVKQLQWQRAPASDALATSGVSIHDDILASVLPVDFEQQTTQTGIPTVLSGQDRPATNTNTPMLMGLCSNGLQRSTVAGYTILGESQNEESPHRHPSSRDSLRIQQQLSFMGRIPFWTMHYRPGDRTLRVSSPPENISQYVTVARLTND